MAVEQIKQAAAGLYGPKPDSKPAERNRFNSNFINPFEKLEISSLPQAQKTWQSAAKSAQLFGNKLVGQEATRTEELPQTSTEGIFFWTNFLKSKTAQAKNFISNISSNVNEYDAAVNTALKYLPSPGDLNAVANSLPTVKAILAKEGLPLKMNYDNLKTIKHTHLSTTIEFARAIGKELGMNDTELKTMEAGAALHDLGKALIPSEILNKQGRLNQDERKIINLHSVLGYEMLKGLGFGTNVAEIARDHHNPNSTNRMAQIVRAADVYSAMREERPYKTAKTHDEAMAVLKNMNIKPEILAALNKNYAPKKQPEQQGVTVSVRTQASAA